MFNTFSMDKHSTLASKEYVKVFNIIFDILQREFPKETAYLRKLNLKDLKIYECSSMTIENGICGAWTLTKPDNLYLQKWIDSTKQEGCDGGCYCTYYNGVDVRAYDDACSALCSELVWVTVLHELAHKYQYTCSPLLYIVNRCVTLFVDGIPFLQEVGIEYDARRRSEVPVIQEFLRELFRTFTIVSNGQLVRALETVSEERKHTLSKFQVELYKQALSGKSDEYSPSTVKLACEIFDRIYKQN